MDGIFCIPIVKRPSSFAFRASTSPDAVLARRPQTQKPSSRAVLLLVCLCYQTFCLRYHILSCCYKLSRLLCYQNLSPAATKNCPSYQFFAVTILLVTRLSLLSWTAQNLPSLPDPLSCLLLNFTSFSLLVCPCYQTSVAVPDSPESALVTRLSLGLLLNCPCYQFFAATNLPLLPDFHCCPRQPRILVRVYLCACLGA